tara:strand:+ start:310 stop:753 length:444 start_codon:yes stop_codon:yes gene_type:complete
MSRQSKKIILMERLLTHLKNAKLEYLKASDHANTSEEKRFFNNQALIRNRFFQQILSELQNIGVTFDELIINKFNLDQLLVSTIAKLKSTAVHKCLEADKMLLKLYAEFVESNNENSEFLNHISSIQIAIDKNQVLVNRYLYKKQMN